MRHNEVAMRLGMDLSGACIFGLTGSIVPQRKEQTIMPETFIHRSRRQVVG